MAVTGRDVTDIPRTVTGRTRPEPSRAVTSAAGWERKAGRDGTGPARGGSRLVSPFRGVLILPELKTRGAFGVYHSTEENANN